jgi:hypothetical protein
MKHLVVLHLCNMDFECFFWTMLFMVHVWSIHLCFAFPLDGYQIFFCVYFLHLFKHILMALVKMGIMNKLGINPIPKEGFNLSLFLSWFFLWYLACPRSYFQILKLSFYYLHFNYSLVHNQSIMHISFQNDQRIR